MRGRQEGGKKKEKKHKMLTSSYLMFTSKHRTEFMNSVLCSFIILNNFHIFIILGRISFYIPFYIHFSINVGSICLNPLLNMRKLKIFKIHLFALTIILNYSFCSNLLSQWKQFQHLCYEYCRMTKPSFYMIQKE